MLASLRGLDRSLLLLVKVLLGWRGRRRHPEMAMFSGRDGKQNSRFT